jgi:hypothetical protein
MWIPTKLFRNLSTRSYLIVFLIIVLTTIKIPEGNSENFFSIIPHKDKIAHFVFFCLLTLSVKYDLKIYTHITFRIITLLFSFGLIIEIIQLLFLSYRSFEFFDLAINLGGIIFGLYLYIKLSI